MKVLIVEDSPGYAMLVREVLADAAPGEFDVITVSRMSEAVPLLLGLGRPALDAILLDLGLPDADGLQTLEQRIAGRWSLATALAFLAWFVFAPQCISTIAVTRRETNGWKWPIFMVTYLFVLAYIAAGATYWTAVAFGLG